MQHPSTADLATTSGVQGQGDSDDLVTTCVSLYHGRQPVRHLVVPAPSGSLATARPRVVHAIDEHVRRLPAEPNLSRPGNLEKWYRIERGKRRLAYGLMRPGLPVRTRSEGPEHGIAFDFLSSQDAPPDRPVLTGHANGVITLNIDEADHAEREWMRVDMDETYRTLVGHFSHEIGHYYWDVLIRDGGCLETFRTLFGDERQDYGQALDDHYRNGPPPDWQDHVITTYASSHPWEDWAETWAHYMHITDTLETAAHFGLEVERRLPDGSVQRADPEFDPYDIADFKPTIDNWLPLTFAINSLNQSMGQQCLYPFVLPQPAIDKLAYVHGVIREAAGR